MVRRAEVLLLERRLELLGEWLHLHERAETLASMRQLRSHYDSQLRNVDRARLRQP